MADYDIYREQLAIKYPSYGHALWDPSPRISDKPVQVGDVGFIRRGKFHRLFNALLPADDPSHERGVPESHEPLVPVHLDTGFLRQNDYCSTGVSAEPDSGYHPKGPDDFPKVSFQNRGSRGAAVLSLPVTARREDTPAHVDFKWWIVKHIDSWLAFAGKLGVVIDQMEEIILVTGCHRAKSWANVAFLENQVDAQVTFGMKVEGPDNNIEFQISRGNVHGAVLRLGPEGTNLPENQCIFIRGFRVARSPRRLKAPAEPSPDLGYYCDPDTEVKSIPVASKRDPLFLLLEYIAEQASDCDMVLIHDDDLVTIDGLGHDASLDSLEPEVMMDLLRKSNIDMDKVLCDLPPTDNDPSANTSVVKVAMVSMKSQNLNSNIGSQSQRSPLAGQNIDLGSSDPRGLSLSAVPGSLPVPTIRGDIRKRKTSPLADHGDSALSTSQDLADITLHGLGDGTDSKYFVVLAIQGLRNLSLFSHVWPSLSKFAHVVRDKLLITVVLKFCAISLFGWVFLSNWAVESKLFLTLLLASAPLSVWLEHGYMCAELGAAGVPVSFADCRNCPNPCGDGHEDYPPRIVSKMDTTSYMLGSVKPYRRQVVISTGKDDWEHTVTEVQGSLASYISNIKNAEPLTIVSPSNLPIEGIFKDSENHAVGILNGSHKTLSYDNHETVLVFPDYKVLTEVPRSLDGARELWRNSVNPSVSRLGSSSGSSSVRSWVIPYTCVILICERYLVDARVYAENELASAPYLTGSHGKRDVRCAVVAPILERAFTQNLLSEGWDVHTKLEDPTGSPLEDYHDEHEKEAEFCRRLKELDEDSSKRALILMTSHVTGHKYAGNVIIYMPHGAGVWYGRVSAHEVASIVHTTILGGRILVPLLRGGVNLARPDCKGLNDW